MSAKFEIDAPATVGDVVSWSVTESATQASPVEPVRGTPAFGAVVKKTDKTKFAAHQGASITDERLGTVDGYVRSIGPGAASASLDCQTVLNQLNVDAEFSETFFPEGLLSDYVKQLAEKVAITAQIPSGGGGSGPQPDPDAGLAWVPQTAPAGAWRDVTYGDGLFVAVADTAPYVMSSGDGITWAAVPGAPVGLWASIAYGNGVFVAVAPNTAPHIMTSPDGVTWTTRAATTRAWRDVAFGNGVFVVTASSGANPVMTSTNGTSWTAQSAPSVPVQDVTYGGGLFVAVGNNTAMTSPDGITWASQTVPAGFWLSVAYGNGIFVAGTGGSFMTSTDAATWTSTQILPNASWQSIAYGNGRFVAVTPTTVTNRAMTSPDGLTWTPAVTPSSTWQGVAYGASMFVAVANGGAPVTTSGTFAPPTPPVETINWEGTKNPVVTFIPWRGNIWQMLNSLLMLNGVELVYSGGQMVVRDIGSVVTELDDATVITRTITAVDARQSVDVAYREAFIQSGTIYDAYEDGNKVYSIETNEYRVDEVVYEVPLTRYNLVTNKMEQYGVTTNVPTALDQPLEAPYMTARPAAGYYVISGRDNLPLAPGQFEDYGGKIEVALNPDNPFSFLLRWNGPKTDIPGVEGPYSLSADGHGAFSVTGTATYATDKKVNVRTGADPAIVTDATPLALDLPFVNSKLQAFDVGAKAGADLCATVEEVTFSVATEKLEGFGLTPGSIFRWDNAYWRVTSATIGRLATAITARAHTTFGQADTELANLTYGQFDALWGLYGYKDFKIEPLRTA